MKGRGPHPSPRLGHAIKIALLLVAGLPAAAAPASGVPSEATPRPGTATQSQRFAQFLHTVYERELAASPELATENGSRLGDDRWDDESERALAARAAQNRRNIELAKRRFDPSELDAAMALQYRVFLDEQQLFLDRYRWRDHLYALNQIVGLHIDVPGTLTGKQPFASEADAAAYIRRISAVAPAFRNLLAHLRTQTRQGIYMPKSVYPLLVEGARNVISGAPHDAGPDSPIYADFKRRIGLLGLPQARSAELIDEARVALVHDLEPAYRALIVELEAEGKRTPIDGGVWQLPDGDAFYRFLIRQFTTTDMTPAEVHEMGLAEVAHSQAEIAALMQRIGFTGSVREFMAKMKADPRNYESNDDAGRAAYLERARAIVAAMQAKITTAFLAPAPLPLQIVRTEAYKEASSPPGFYEPGSADGTRPGTVYLNLADMRLCPLDELEDLLYHEGVPGHHMQISTIMVDHSIPELRKVNQWWQDTAFVEGWGLYAERLGKDLGFYRDPYSEFGLLSGELWRATRLVVDSGLHYKHWTRQEAIQYLNDNTPSAEATNERAVDRYVAVPGQATSFMVGMRHFVAERERARQALGERFDLREYHAQALGSGFIPLWALTQKIDAYIQSKSAATPEPAAAPTTVMATPPAPTAAAPTLGAPMPTATTNALPPAAPSPAMPPPSAPMPTATTTPPPIAPSPATQPRSASPPAVPPSASPPEAQPPANPAFEAMLESYWQDRLDLEPQLGLTHSDRRHLDRFDDSLEDGWRKKMLAMLDHYLAAAAAYSPAALSDTDRTSLAMLEDQLTLAKHYYSGPLFETARMLPINQFQGEHASFAADAAGGGDYPFATLDDYQKALARADAFARWTRDAIARLREGIRRGVVLPRLVIERVLPELEVHTARPAEQTEFWRPIASFPPSLPAAERARLERAYRRKIETVIEPAYRGLHRYLHDDYLPHARSSVGLSDIPGGRALYEYDVRYHTTTHRTPEEIHALGRQEVERIEGQLAEVQRKLGIDGDLHALYARVREDASQKFASPDQIVPAFEAARQVIVPRLPALFDVLPQAVFEIRALPDSAKSSQGNGYYAPAGADGSRPGILWINIYAPGVSDRFNVMTLTLHEGLPGHHFQTSVAQEQAHLPSFRRFDFTNAYGEGWALYAESLGRELGVFGDPWSYYGHLNYAILRANRLVIDTGLNALGWDLDTGIRWMMDHSSMTRDQAAAEVERYIAIPGQALSYKLGELEIQRLRHLAEERLGANFDIKAFHDQVLLGGSMPLTILDQRVERWISTTGSN